MPSINRAGPMPYASDPKISSRERVPSLKVICKKRDIVLNFKFLVSKVTFEDEGLSEEETVILKDLFIRFCDMAERDVNFERYLIPLIEIRELIEKIQPNLSRSNGLRREFLRLDSMALTLILNGLHEYYGIKNQKDRAKARVVKIYFHPRKPTLQRYMGVGYKDKGYLPNLAENGTPSWKEVSRDSTYQSTVRISKRWSVFDEQPQRTPIAKIGVAKPEEGLKYRISTCSGNSPVEVF